MLYNRDLSWLGFNDRILQEAENNSIPLYERLKFLAIFSSNLDEFFRVRFPSVLALSQLGKKSRNKFQNSDEDVVETAQRIINAQLDRFGNVLNNELIPSLKQTGTHFYYNEAFKDVHSKEARSIMLSEILSFIQPVLIGSQDSKGFIPENNELYLIVLIENKKKTNSIYAVNIPSNKLNRFYTLERVDEVNYVAFLDDIIRYNLDLVFPGKNIRSTFSIKLNRDAELVLEDDFTDRILEKLEKKLELRELGAPSRFLYEKGMPASLRLFLGENFNVSLIEMFEGGRYHNISDLFKFPVFNKELQFKPAEVHQFPQQAYEGNLFNLIDENDILLHLPYDSYEPVLIFFNQAAIDPEVTHISVTLYRVAKESRIVNALISAAKNGKKVTAFVELKARFDEANNIRWSRVMKDAGVQLIYSDPSIKVHSKIALIRKNNGKEKSNYSIISTGNFNESTASLYTDHVLFTSDKKITGDIKTLFDILEKGDTSKFSFKTFENIFVSKFNLITWFEKMVRKQIANAEKGEDAYIRIKVNNLEEPYIIELLYKASQAGVKINLIVRTICCIIPGLQGLSENITIKRIVGRYLEHSRFFIFGKGSTTEVAMGSSDLMIRNLRRRIEVCVPLQNEKTKQEIIEYFDVQWNNNKNTVVLDENMHQSKIPGAENENDAQDAIMDFVKRIHAQ